MNDSRLTHCASIALTVATLALSAGPAAAHIVLSQKTFEAGTNFAAFFKVEHGCDGSPTVSLRVEIPDGVSVLELPPKDGWTTNAERSNGTIKAVSWRGRLEGGQADQFGVLLKLPSRTGAIYFPTVQRCAKGEMRWTEIPVGIQTAKDLKRPAPSVELTAAVERPAMYMAGDMMVMQPWSRATPPGATTGAGSSEPRSRRRADHAGSVEAPRAVGGPSTGAPFGAEAARLGAPAGAGTGRRISDGTVARGRREPAAGSVGAAGPRQHPAVQRPVRLQFPRALRGSGGAHGVADAARDVAT